MPCRLALPLGRRIALVCFVAVSINVTTAATSYESERSVGSRLATNSVFPSGVMAAAIGSRLAGTLAVSFLASRSMIDTLSLYRLHTYKRLPSGLTTGAPGVWPTGIVAASRPEAASITPTVPCGNPNVTYSVAPSGLSANPVGVEGSAMVRKTLPAKSTTAICFASMQST